ncbi:unnamed protein product [Tuwongella immobilis]|uniref:Uncharacterized protein n=1 Tax=Tuwongella immobilis TaxID=692036 RepID=A0A6C2YN14_9BACT|nr:unnamed protein product [Tuwongella immobilis]VTS03088.1 unnamed protein product [Tuwongella immobilis]
MAARRQKPPAWFPISHQLGLQLRANFRIFGSLVVFRDNQRGPLNSLGAQIGDECIGIATIEAERGQS